MKAEPRGDYRHLYRFYERAGFRDDLKEYETLLANPVGLVTVL